MTLRCRFGPGLQFGELNPLSLRPVTRLTTACGLSCRLACFPGTRSLECFSMSLRTGGKVGELCPGHTPHPACLTSSEAGVYSVAHCSYFVIYTFPRGLLCKCQIDYVEVCVRALGQYIFQN